MKVTVKRLLCALLVLLCGGMLWGCSNKPSVDVKLNHEYFMTYMVPYAFPHKMVTNDRSSLEFDKGLKEMWITFVTSGEHKRVNFTITSVTRKNGQIKGTCSRLDSGNPDPNNKGKLLRYSFRSDKDTIYLHTLVSYKVYTATDSHVLVTVERNTDVAKFARTTPGYIGGGT